MAKLSKKTKTPPTHSAPSKLPGKPKVQIDENRMYVLVRAVVEAGNLQLDPEWVLEADAAERKGLLTRIRLQLFPTELGRGYVNEISEPEKTRDRAERTMIRCTRHTRYLLKVIAREQGVLEFDALGLILEAFYNARAELTRAAHAAGREYPWEALDLRQKK
jgi:hypothetical protein